MFVGETYDERERWDFALKLHPVFNVRLQKEKRRWTADSEWQEQSMESDVKNSHYQSSPAL